jgi:hypothetical protein
MTSACSTTRLPLCPDLAKTTYTSSDDPTVYGKYVTINASRLNITLAALSPYVMRVTGTPWDVANFKSDYRFEVCAFSASQVTVPHETFLRCMDHADQWVGIVNSKAPENLMLTEYEYESTCASGRPQ